MPGRIAAPAGRGVHAESPVAGAPEPFYFPSGGRQLFGWLHPAASGGPQAWGVVLCNAFGYEAHCAHRSVHAFADVISLLGIPALRFDYLGTGDSPEIDPSADQIEAWAADIVHAVAQLRRCTGVDRVCLLGFRLGALLATLAAPRCEVEALALVAPVLNGRRYLKEARILQLAADAAEAAASAEVPTREADREAEPGLIEISGHPLSAASIASLSQLKATADGLRGVSAALVIDRADLPSASQWAEELTRAQVRVAYRKLPGFVEMMMTPPHLGAVPKEMIEATRQWLSDIAEASPVRRPERHPGARQPELPASCRQLAIRGAGDSETSGLIERPLFVTGDRGVFGIVTEPRGDERRRRGVIISNSGAEYHVGVSLISVSLAREWARRGYYVLRMDLSGLGDSRTRPGSRDDEVFPAGAVTDIGAAVQQMKTRYGIQDFTLMGFCSGGYHSLRSAVAGLPVNRLLMVNVQDFHRDPSAKTEGLQLAEVVRNPALYRERVFSAAAWKRLLAGRLNVRNVVRVYLRFSLLPLKSRARNLGRLLGVRMRNDLGHELQAIVTRGVRVVFIYSHGEPGIGLLTVEAGTMLKRLGDRCRVRIIEGADHVFSRRRARSRLIEVLSEELFERNESSSARLTRC